MDDPNPIHFDTAAARAAGLGARPVAQGPLTFGYLLVMAARPAGGHARPPQARIRLLRNVFAGDRLECHAVNHQVTPHAQHATLPFRAQAAATPAPTTAPPPPPTH